MHTTGIKEGIVNKLADISYSSTKLDVKNFGKFDIAKITRLSVMAPIAERGTAGTHETVTFTTSGVAPTVGDIVVVKLVFKSLKGGFADFENTNVDGGKTLSVSFKFVSNNDVATQVAKALSNANTNYSIHTATAAANAVNIIYSDTSVFLDAVTMAGEHNTSVGLAAAITVTVAATLGRNNPKQMTEQVRVATSPNFHPEGFTLEQQVDMNHGYYAISFNYDASNDLPGGPYNGRPTRNAEFVLYVNESIYTPSKAGADALNSFYVDYLGQPSITEAANEGEWIASDYYGIYLDGVVDSTGDEGNTYPA